jgi:hypothetical protein
MEPGGRARGGHAAGLASVRPLDGVVGQSAAHAAGAAPSALCRLITITRHTQLRDDGWLLLLTQGIIIVKTVAKRGETMAVVHTILILLASVVGGAIVAGLMSLIATAIFK